MTIGLVVAVCVLGALSAPAFAKEKAVFGEFEASIAGQNLETTPGKLQVWKEDEAELNGLQLGNYKFGPVIKTGPEAGKQNLSDPCSKLKFSGSVNKEKTPYIIGKLSFMKCPTVGGAGGSLEEKPVSFALSVRFNANLSAEVGKSEAGLEIESGTVEFKGQERKCPVLIGKQTIPIKVNEEKEYEEIVEYSNETPEPIENWEKSKKLKEMYPSGVKERIEIELGEKFKGLRTYVANKAPCNNTKGEESPKLVEEPSSPYYGMLEYTSGHIFADIEGIEVKDGEIKFGPPAS
ncbi:MAG: hypothetical protein ACLQBB_04665 [Solirubrobacteraceae bacterium]